MTSFDCPFDAVHRCWDNNLLPALTVDPGDTVTFTTIDAGDGRIPPPSWAGNPGSPPERGIRPASVRSGHPLCGPVAIRGAQAGDTLAVEVLEIVPDAWGWTDFAPDFGLLADEFEGRELIYWDLRGEKAVVRSDDPARRPMPVRLSQNPFCGVMGVAPAEPGEHSTTPPRSVGGNMDVRHLVPGSTLYLPVAVDGALFSAGDVHAAQGDGEVCGTGIECGARVTLRFGLQRSRRLSAPEYRTVEVRTPGPRYGTTGVAPDLMEATKQAVRGMITYLHDEHGFSRAEAYLLCSVAVDLAVSEVVDAPNWIVSAVLPLEVLAT
ncbi:MAG TPA: acetamidase/formamidase family protein [Chloroflexota bacterium]|nr:acetamidase/formamidase family protein [Chloroflexota bacterium]